MPLPLPRGCSVSSHRLWYYCECAARNIVSIKTGKKTDKLHLTALPMLIESPTGHPRRWMGQLMSYATCIHLRLWCSSHQVCAEVCHKPISTTKCSLSAHCPAVPTHENRQNRSGTPAHILRLTASVESLPPLGSFQTP
jgi:hypothetical protein